MSVAWGPSFVVLLPGLALIVATLVLLDGGLQVPALAAIAVVAGIAQLKWVPLRKK